MANTITITTGDHSRVTWSTTDYAGQAPLTGGDWSARADISELAGKTKVVSWTVGTATVSTTTVTDDTLTFNLSLTPTITRSLIPIVTTPTQTRTLVTDLEVTGPGVYGGDEIHTHGPVTVTVVQDVTI